jgi:hypothetical protein
VWQWHQDYGTWKNDDLMPTERAMNVAIFLDDVNEFNGPLMFIPGSHKKGVVAAKHDLSTTSYPLWTVDNPLIGESAQLHWRHLRRVMGAVLQEMGQREAVWDEHEAIAKAIAAGDGERAARLIEEHSLHASENLGARLDLVLHSQPAPRRQP